MSSFTSLGKKELCKGLVVGVAVSQLIGASRIDAQETNLSRAQLPPPMGTPLRLAAKPADALSIARPNEKARFTPRDCPNISDSATIVANVSVAKSSAPWTLHAGIDLTVKDNGQSYVLRIHFGQHLTPGTNSVMPFDAMDNDRRVMKALPLAHTVETARVKKLLADLAKRNFEVGPYKDWGVPIWPLRAQGSNCGDAFMRVADILGIGQAIKPELKSYFKENRLSTLRWKWSQDRGRRTQAGNDFYNPD